MTGRPASASASCSARTRPDASGRAASCAGGCTSTASAPPSRAAWAIATVRRITSSVRVRGSVGSAAPSAGTPQPAMMTAGLGIARRQLARMRSRICPSRWRPRPVCAHTATPPAGCRAIQLAYASCASPCSCPLARRGTGTAGMRVPSSRVARSRAGAARDRVASVTVRHGRKVRRFSHVEDARRGWAREASGRGRPMICFGGMPRQLAARMITAPDSFMTKTPLHALHEAGQSIWLDYIDRTLVRGGELSQRIERDVVTGMTSNPTIFEKALTESDTYDDQLAAAPPTHTSWQLFEMIATDDVRDACDVFREVYETSGHADGFVSIEVSPGAAHDVEETLAEARRLWTSVDRPNVMIKVPGTRDGAIAARRLIADGINVNITLLFALDAYADVIEAYLGGLEDRVRTGQPVDRIASVASFFVSRVDTEVDKRIDARAGSLTGPDAERLRALRGRIAIANAKVAYALFQERFSGARWQALAASGARVQRPLWASTSTKNPAYRDVMYVEALIGPDTVDTMPPQTIDAFRDHGIVARTVDADLDRERRAIADLESLGISLASVTDKLLVDGLASFQKSFEGLLERLEQKVVG